MTAQIEKRIDLGDTHVLRRICDLQNFVAGSDFPFFQNAKVKTRSMMRDHQGPVVWKDIEAFIRDPEAPLPSGAPKIPTAPPHVPETHVAAGL